MSKRSYPRATRDRFLILARAPGPAAHNLQRIFAPLGLTEIVVDSPTAADGHIYYPDEALSGYTNIMGCDHFPTLTAWSRAMFHLERSLARDESVWFVEADVAGHPLAFSALVNLCHRENPDLAARELRTPVSDPQWHWWKHAPDPDWFENPRSTFNPLARLSARLLEQILLMRRRKGRFTFHEILFASVAHRAGFTIMDWGASPEHNSLFAEFRWRPELSAPTLGIAHPVKDVQLHGLISGDAAAPGQPRRVAAERSTPKHTP